MFSFLSNMLFGAPREPQVTQQPTEIINNLVPNLPYPLPGLQNAMYQLAMAQLRSLGRYMVDAQGNPVRPIDYFPSPFGLPIAIPGMSPPMGGMFGYPTWMNPYGPSFAPMGGGFPLGPLLPPFGTGGMPWGTPRQPIPIETSWTVNTPEGPVQVATDRPSPSSRAEQMTKPTKGGISLG